MKTQTQTETLLSFSTAPYYEAVHGVTFVAEQLDHVLSYKPEYWKWVILGMHSMIQNWMVEALKRSDSNGAYDHISDRPNWLLDFMVLYHRTKSEKHMPRSYLRLSSSYQPRITGRG